MSIDHALASGSAEQTMGGAPPRPAGASGRRSGQPRMPRRPRALTLADVGVLLGSAASSLCVCWLVAGRLTDGFGWFGFLVVAYLLFLAIFAIVTADRLSGLVATDRVVTVVIVTGAIALLVPLAFLIGFIVVKGLPALRATFLTDDQLGITPTMPSDAGGGLHAVIGTLEQAALALVISLPLGLSAAIFLNETRSKLRRPVRIFVDAMSGLPSVVAGLFVFAVLILPFAQSGNPLFGFNGFMAALALSMVMLPTITRTVEVVLRLVPDGLREASLAMGASRARTVWSVVLPTARTGVTTAVVLGIARIVGETAPLLFTAFGYDLVNANPFNGPQESLPLFVYRNVIKPDRSAVERAFAGALVLLLIILALFCLARFIGRDRSARSSRRPLRHRFRSAPSRERSPS